MVRSVALNKPHSMLPATSCGNLVEVGFVWVRFCTALLILKEKLGSFSEKRGGEGGAGRLSDRVIERIDSLTH